VSCGMNQELSHSDIQLMIRRELADQGYINREELRDYLKENISVRIEAEQQVCQFEGPYLVFKVELWLAGELIAVDDAAA
jgi:hypothetical protein